MSEPLPNSPETAPDAVAEAPKRRRIPKADRSRDLYILIIVVLVIIMAVKFLMDFMAWDKLQTCAMTGRRNCAPTIEPR